MSGRAQRLTSDPRRTAGGFYIGKNPRAGVSGSILQFVRARAGRRVLDIGCGTGGLAAVLQELGFEVEAVDSNPEHVAIASGLGVHAQQVDGRLPFPDKSVDTVIMVEVLEHVPDEEMDGLLKDVRRVSRRNVLITVPDCQDVDALAPSGLTCEHFLAADHVQFFTRDRLSALLGGLFPRVDIVRGDPAAPHLLLPAPVRRTLSALWRIGALPPLYYTRLFVEACVDG